MLKRKLKTETSRVKVFILNIHLNADFVKFRQRSVCREVYLCRCCI